MNIMHASVLYYDTGIAPRWHSSQPTNIMNTDRHYVIYLNSHSGWVWSGRNLRPHQRKTSIEGIRGDSAERAWGEDWLYIYVYFSLVAQVM